MRRCIMEKISTDQLHAQLQTKETKILDVRASEKFDSGHLEHKNATVLNIPKTEIFALESTDTPMNFPISKDEEIILTCTTGNSATRCAHILADQGYHVKVLDGGMTAWNTSKDKE